tara:strand:+ start:352 stop:1119 length:768 start_codon:yes stop_codon:yes gene_type:complete
MSFISNCYRLQALFLLLSTTSWCLSPYARKPNHPLKPTVQNVARDFSLAREKMVETQILARGIKDIRLLESLRRVPRHRFVPFKFWDLAYTDRPLPIGDDQTISQPYMVAYMTQQLELKGHEKVLEIGTGSGYQAAVLSELSNKVYSIEIICDLAQQASTMLNHLKYQVQVKCDDGYKGWPENGPFDAIMITAAAPKVPEPLLEQLKAGGRMIMPLGNNYQELILIEKKQHGTSSRRLIPVRFVPMTGEVRLTTD